MLIPFLLSVTPNGSIAGRVIYNTAASPDQSVALSRRREGGLNGITVHLSNAVNEYHQLMTAADGSFSIEGLPDGNYTVQINLTDNALPSGYWGSSSVSQQATIIGGNAPNIEFIVYPIQTICYAIADGDWDASATWASKQIPGMLDKVYANGKLVVINNNISVERLSNSTPATATTICAGGEFVASQSIRLTLDYLECVGIQPCLRAPNGVDLRLFADVHAKPISVAKNINIDNDIAALPILCDGYTITSDSQTTETDMDSGFRRTRRTRTTAYDSVSVQWLLTHEQFVQWREWFRDSLNAGERWTKLRLMTGEDPSALDVIPLRTCKFKGGQGKPPFSATQNGRMWSVKAEVWVLPELLNG